jgi:outer membrane protein OmpA-like peptidoglycan-associated protein
MKAMFNRVLCIVWGCLRAATAFSQGEFRNDCTYAKEIIVPFSWRESGAADEKPMLDQTVFYNYREQFSYWYKILAKETGTLSFYAKAINDSDEYVLYVYQYNEADFCDKIYDQKIRALKPSVFTPAKSDPYDLSQRSFTVTKGNTYYISVLNTSLTNCGHLMYMRMGADTLKVKALHLPCDRNIAALAVKDFKLPEKKDATPPAAKKDTLKPDPAPPLVKKDSVQPVKAAGAELFCLVKNAVKKTPVDARISISEVESNEGLSINMCGTGNCTGTLQEGKSYQIRVSAFGYKNATQTIRATGGKNNVEILLQPYKTGENFVMKTIYFYPNTYALKKEASPELQKLLKLMQENDQMRIEIQGHTNGDNRISKNKAYSKRGEEWNFRGTSRKLSEKRAQTIRQFLITNGIAEDRIEAKGYGGKVPVIKDPQNNEEGQMNIRVEVSILKS